MTDAFVDEVDGRRSQELIYEYELNGAIYWYSVDKYLNHKRQLIAGAATYEMPYWCSIDIDDMTDFALCELILRIGDDLIF